MMDSTTTLHMTITALAILIELELPVREDEEFNMDGGFPSHSFELLIRRREFVY